MQKEKWTTLEGLQIRIGPWGHPVSTPISLTDAQFYIENTWLPFHDETDPRHARVLAWLEVVQDYLDETTPWPGASEAIDDLTGAAIWYLTQDPPQKGRVPLDDFLWSSCEKKFSREERQFMVKLARKRAEGYILMMKTQDDETSKHSV